MQSYEPTQEDHAVRVTGRVLPPRLKRYHRQTVVIHSDRIEYVSGEKREDEAKSD